MKKQASFFILFLLLSILVGCEKELSGNYGDTSAVRIIAIESVSEYDSLGKTLLNEYELKKVEDKDTFWLRSYKTKDTLSMKVDTIYMDGSESEILKIDTVYEFSKDYLKYYNDLTKKCRYIRYDTIRMKYSKQFTELRTLINSNGRWKASNIEFSAPTTQLMWAFPLGQYGGGNSLLCVNSKFGATGKARRACVTQQLYTPDSLILFQFNVTRDGLLTPSN